MGMGYAPAFVVEIDKVDLEKTGLKSYKEFLNMVEESGMDFDQIAQIIEEVEREYGIDGGTDSPYIEELCDNYGIRNDEYVDIAKAFINFRDEFNQKYGLSINCGYHDVSERGDRYDDIDGGFFYLDFGEIYELSDKAKMLQKDVPFQISQFVVFG